ncbi:Cof-type HAD-IIB family hydrolase [Sporosarcina thermotolerans]|uniref:Cof-type HAD-IIB family hydrolase n=1 Tax=Sporosarcina thermotolerans TaxID=633404 RepID=A0AAW9AGL6_9BACL|nr:Cof-type HAD-IIB family hydrolase [Sporosarcina thermotolerans]MDW0118196.1 Cof-type HAD-IIB family hydrolase [Sporosarcina thermotolerans]WHT47677.1 Cof-type HAD-IIB family hydrolase [Sporosarcina thermotolerans]
MNYKIIFFDVDGTLINYEDGCISTSTKNAIRTLKSKGIKLVAATGRPLSMCQELKTLGIETFITANGAYTKHQDEVIHKIPLPKHIVHSVKEIAEENKQSLSFFTEELTMNGIQSPLTFQAMSETLSLTEYPKLNEENHNEEIYLMCLYAGEEIIRDYEIQFPNLIFQRWHPHIVNVLHEDVSKSIAIKEVLKYFNIHYSEAIAFGDGDNDIDMLEMVGYGISMGNGSDKLKKSADFVTKKSNEDGIEFALRYLQLI